MLPLRDQRNSASSHSYSLCALMPWRGIQALRLNAINSHPSFRHNCICFSHIIFRSPITCTPRKGPHHYLLGFLLCSFKYCSLQWQDLLLIPLEPGKSQLHNTPNSPTFPCLSVPHLFGTSFSDTPSILDIAPHFPLVNPLSAAEMVGLIQHIFHGAHQVGLGH